MLKLLLSAGLLVIVSSCNTNKVWPEDKQYAFLDICEQSVNDIMSRQEASDYCSCILNQLMEVYPDSLETEAIPQESFNKFAEKCTK